MKIPFLIFLLIAVCFQTRLCSSTIPVFPVGYPSDLPLVSLKNATSLPSALELYGKVRLEVGNYADVFPSGYVLVLKIGHGIYGVPYQTTLPAIQLEVGATNVTVSGILTPNLYILDSQIPYENNIFVRNIIYKINITGALFSNNWFFDSFTNIYVNLTLGGYLRNNYFFRILFIENPNQASYGNTIVWNNCLSGGDAENGLFSFSNIDEFTIIAQDVEVYPTSPRSSALFTSDNTITSLRMLTTQGRLESPSPDTTPQAGLFDLDAYEFVSIGNRLYEVNVNATDVIFGSSSDRVLMLDYDVSWSIGDGNAKGFRMLGNDSGFVTVNNQSVFRQPLSPSNQQILDSILSASYRVTSPFPKPSFDVIPDPAGPNWNSDLPSQPDSSDYIQHLINTNGIALLPAGKYYIGKSLALNNTNGIIGAGANVTVLIAKDPSIDMIVGNHTNTLFGCLLSDITLQGGRTGIYHTNQSGIPHLAQFVSMFISHVTFRDMADSGILFENIFGWDNNFLDYLNFINCPSGIRQHVTDMNITDNMLTYMDKCVFYNNQFVNCGIALNLPAHRADNLNAWINCKFENNSQVAYFTNHNSVNFINSIFINNGGNPTIEAIGSTASIVNCDFIVGNFIIEGSTFTSNMNTSATLFSKTTNNTGLSIYNSISDIPLGPIFSGLFVNSHITTNPELSQLGVVVDAGVAYTFLPGTPDYTPQFLVYTEKTSSRSSKSKGGQSPVLIS